jgi:hypothetical protein
MRFNETFVDETLPDKKIVDVDVFGFRRTATADFTTFDFTRGFLVREFQSHQRLVYPLRNKINEPRSAATFE